VVLVIVAEATSICSTLREVIRTLQDQLLGLSFLTDEFATTIIPEVSVSLLAFVLRTLIAIIGNEN